jgi:hypothetical protein
MTTDPRFIELQVPLEDMTAFERGQLYEQARQIENRFAPRDRPNVSGVFANLAISALMHNPAERYASTSAIPKDVTAPDEHYRDDLGTIMAQAMILEGDPWTLPGVRAAWAKVIRDLQDERDRMFGTHQGK